MTLGRLVRRKGHLTLREPGQCPACHDGWERLRADSRCGDNFKDARQLRSRVKRYISGHPGCTLRELQRRFDCSETVLGICLHILVDDFQLSGPDPYACGAPNDHEASTYRVLHLPGPPSE